MKPNNFDRVAFIYDTLAFIFFGNNLRKAQSHFLNRLPANSKVLVLGSGTGWFANEILKNVPNSKITLVDSSQQMTNRAIDKLKGTPVEIFCADENKRFPEPFDVVILPFFLDMFPNEKIDKVIKVISNSTKPETTWLIIDFVSKRSWHQVYLWTMYRFFKLTCDIEAGHLPDWQALLTSNKVFINETKDFYKGFIQSTLGYSIKAYP